MLFVSLGAVISLNAVLGSNVLAVELPFLEGGTLYKSSIDGLPSSAKKKVASNVDRVLHYTHSTGKLLYTTNPVNDEKVGDLWLANMATNETTQIARGVIDAHLSPDGAMVAFWNKYHEIHLVTAEGTPLAQIGSRGAAPLFSHNGKLVAYEKLSDISFDEDDQSFFEFAQGIAVYDIATKQETLLTRTEHGEDYAPVAFSSDLSRLYFNSTRTGVASLWSVNIDGSGLRQITNINSPPSLSAARIPVISQVALWSSDRLIAISSIGAEKEIWLFRFTRDGTLPEARLLAHGELPQWLVDDRTVIFRAVNGKWQTYHIQ